MKDQRFWKVVRNRKLEGSSPVCSIFILRHNVERQSLFVEKIMLFKKVNVKGINVFYRECGNEDQPVMLLFHGFPSASHMFRDLMPMLEDKFHCIAMDYPGFGNTDSPSRTKFKYTFDHMAEICDAFIEEMHIDKFYMYVFDYGAPIGFRIAVKNPERILGIVSQNGNVYEEGLGPKSGILEKPNTRIKRTV